jgi:glycosyltransferase involved in cell wall biosynthesis
VTAVIPVHHGAEVIGRALSSIAAGTVQPSEVIVVEDGPDPDLQAALDAQPWGAPVRVLSQPQSGAAAARNRGVDHARTTYVAFLDADDEWSAEHLAAMRRGVAKHPGRVLYVGGCVEIRPDGTTRSFLPPRRLQARPFSTLLVRNPIATSAALAERDTVRTLGGFPEYLQPRAGAEDRGLWLALSHAGRVAIVRDAGCRRHVNPQSVTERPDDEFYADLDDVCVQAARNAGGRAPRLATAGLLLHRATHALRAGHRAEARRLLLRATRAWPLLPDLYLWWLAAILPIRRWRGRTG